MVPGMTTSPRPARRRAARVSSLGLATLLLALVTTHCGGRSVSEQERDGDGHGGSTGTGGEAGVTSGGSKAAGGAPAGGVSSGGSSAGFPAGGSSGTGSPVGGSSGTGPITTTVCGAPVAPGPCDAAIPSYWFDASTGICMPFTYGGCEGNSNRFDTMDECYTTCDAQGLGNAACNYAVECRTVRIAEPCCKTDVREFVGVRFDRDLVCMNPVIGCKYCAADCATTPDDGYVGTSCIGGHCIPFDARAKGFTDCLTDEDCSLRWGVECCENCDVSPSNVVAVSHREELSWLACGPNLACNTACGPPKPGFPTCVEGRCAVRTLEP
jgi:hypothetical protein